MSVKGFRAAVLTFLAPGTDFVEDSFSMAWGGNGDSFGMIQAYYIYNITADLTEAELKQ